jgi:hypothetical protein
MRSTTLIGLVAMMMGAMGCSSGDAVGTAGTQGVAEPDPRTAEALVLEEHTDMRTVGRFRSADGELTFSATLGAEGRPTVAVVVNGKFLDGWVEGADVVVDGHSAVLTDADTRLLGGFAGAFEWKLAGAARAQHDVSLHGLAAYYAVSPAGFVHGRIVNGGTQETPEVAAFAAAGTPVYGNEGKKCVARGSTVLAAYTHKSSSGSTLYASENVVVGSNWGYLAANRGDYNCMGRCGAGCSGGGYTKDCLDHDTCSFRKQATGGRDNVHCGDEFSAASDDYFFNFCAK